MATAVSFVGIDAPQTVWHRDLIKKTCDACRTPEDFDRVMLMLMNGHAALWLIKVGHNTCGAAITTVLTDTLSGVRSYHIWKLHGREFRLYAKEGIAMLHEQRMKFGCKKITFSSTRSGWKKRFNPLVTHYEVT